MTTVEAEDPFRYTGEVTLLGTGPTGHVYKGTDRNGKPFARKDTIIPSSQIAQSWTSHVNEKWKRLKHDNIIELLDARENPVDGKGGPVVVSVYMQYAVHGSIESLYKKDRISQPKIQGFARDMANGLDCIHKEGLIHGDLKCSNILIAGDGERQRAMISDLASSTKVGSSIPTEFQKHPFTTTLQERSFWTAPEVINGAATTTASDVYSYGATLVEIYTSEHPFPELTERQALGEICSGGLPSLPPDSDILHAGDCARDLIKSCLDPNPEKRPTAEEILSHPFVAGALDGSSFAPFGNGDNNLPDFLCR